VICNTQLCICATKQFFLKTRLKIAEEETWLKNLTKIIAAKEWRRKNLTKESQPKLLQSKIGEKKEPNKRISTNCSQNFEKKKNLTKDFTRHPAPKKELFRVDKNYCKILLSGSDNCSNTAIELLRGCQKKGSLVSCMFPICSPIRFPKCSSSSQ